MAYTYERPDLPALAELERVLRSIWPRSWPRWRRRTPQGRGRAARKRRRAAGCVAGTELKESRQRVIELETENQALRQRIDGAKERLRVLAGAARVPGAARRRQRGMSQAKNAVKVHHRRRGVHRPLRAAARVHPRGRRLSRRRAQAGARLAPHGRDPQGRHPGRAGHHRRAVPGPPGRPPDRGPALRHGRRVRPPAAARPSAAAARPPPSGESPMPQSLLLPALVGVAGRPARCARRHRC